MKALFAKYKTAIIFTLLAAIVIVVFFVFFSGDDPAALVSETPSGTSQEVGRDLLSQLLELRSLSLDESIFSNEAFERLVDFSQPLQQQPVGRDNPFAPAGAAGQ